MMDEYRDIADLYDHVVAYRQRTDVPFFVDAARESGGPVLEVGCGTGRVLIPTARAGIEISGLDLSDRMLDVCRERLREEAPEVQARVRLHQGDMRNFELQREFALVTIPFRPFQHLTTVDDQLACLDTIRRHLRPGGALILDLFNPSLEALTKDNLGEEQPDGPPFSTPDGRQVQRYVKFLERDRFRQINYVELIYQVTHPDGRTERVVHPIAMRWLFRYEVEHLLARSGYSIEQVYSDYERNPYGSKYPGELIVVARV